MYRRTMRPSSPFPAAGALLLSLLGLAALLLQRVGAGWVDPDTPANAQTARSYKEGKYGLAHHIKAILITVSRGLPHDA